MRTLSILAITLLPIPVLALTYTESSKQYTDYPFPQPEAAGISILTEIGAVGGYPDGSFRPERTVNRAEFLKIVLGSHPAIRISQSDAQQCFPDVLAEDWFSPYVCIAKKQGIIGGYPDGTFKPAQNVNYVEALKIITELYRDELDYPIGVSEILADIQCAEVIPVCLDKQIEEAVANGMPWYLPYTTWAEQNAVALPIALELDDVLTRGQMARLAASYRAASEDELEAYRRFEVGLEPIEDVEEEEPEPEEMEEESEQEESSSSASSESSLSSVPTYPRARSRLLMTGNRSLPIAEGMFEVPQDATIRTIRIRLSEEVKSITELHLINAQGEDIATLELDPLDEDERIFVEYLTEEEEYPLEANVPTLLMVEATLDVADKRGIALENFEVDRIEIYTSRIEGRDSVRFGPDEHNYPDQLTTVGRIESVAALHTGAPLLVPTQESFLGAFQFTSTTNTDTSAELERLFFSVETQKEVTLDDVYLLRRGFSDRHECGWDVEDRISCHGLDDTIGDFGESAEFTLEVYGSIVVESGSGHTLRISLDNAGDFGENGDVWWNDSSKSYKWLDLESPLANGPHWQLQ